MSASRDPSRAQIVGIALPMVAANAAEPIAGVVDTAIIGASSADGLGLGGVALGVTISNFVLFTFYFIRMSTTGLTAPAIGAGDRLESQRVLLRGLALSAGFGLLASLAAPWIADGALWVFSGEAPVEAAARDYFVARAFGFPAAFAMLATSGWLIAHARGREVLAQQVVYSGVNLLLDAVLVLGFDLGLTGIAAATAIAAWIGAGFGIWRVRAVLGSEGGLHAEARRKLADPGKLRALLAINGDFVVRTWVMQIAFSWFANSGAELGTTVLAANHVLLEIITMSAFVLDAFAYVAEAEVGKATGAASKARLRWVIRVCGELTLVGGALFSLCVWLLAPPAFEYFVASDAVREAALGALPWCVLVPILGGPAWLLDGVFVGATDARSMRNSAIAATAGYLLLDQGLRPWLGVDGMWLAFIGYYLLRATTLILRYPRLERGIDAPTRAGSSP